MEKKIIEKGARKFHLPELSKGFTNDTLILRAVIFVFFAGDFRENINLMQEYLKSKGFFCKGQCVSWLSRTRYFEA